MSSISHSIFTTDSTCGARRPGGPRRRSPTTTRSTFGLALQIAASRRHSPWRCTGHRRHRPVALRVGGHQERAGRRHQLPPGCRCCRPARLRAAAGSPARARDTSHAQSARCRPPTFSGDATRPSIPNHSKANTTPTMPIIESSAPTSCRWTCSSGTSCIAASAAPIRSNSSTARSLRRRGQIRMPDEMRGISFSVR